VQRITPIEARLISIATSPFVVRRLIIGAIMGS
jgi:hypothetical protein